MRSCHLLKLQKDGGVGGHSRSLLQPSPCRTQTVRTRNFRTRAAALTIPSQFTKVRVGVTQAAYTSLAQRAQAPPRRRRACMPVSCHSATACAAVYATSVVMYLHQTLRGRIVSDPDVPSTSL